MQHDFVERQVGDQSLESRVLIAQLVDFTDLGGTELAVFLLPKMNRVLVNAGFPRKLGDWDAGFYATQDCSDIDSGD